MIFLTDLTGLYGMVDCIKAVMADDFLWPWFSDGEREADLPCLGIGTELVKVCNGFNLESLVGVRIPSYLDGLLDLLSRH